MGLLEIECMMDPAVPVIDTMSDLELNPAEKLDLSHYEIKVDFQSEAIVESLSQLKDVPRTIPCLENNSNTEI